MVEFHYRSLPGFRVERTMMDDEFKPYFKVIAEGDIASHIASAEDHWARFCTLLDQSSDLFRRYQIVVEQAASGKKERAFSSPLGEFWLEKRIFLNKDRVCYAAAFLADPLDSQKPADLLSTVKLNTNDNDEWRLPWGGDFPVARDGSGNYSRIGIVDTVRCVLAALLKRSTDSLI